MNALWLVRHAESAGNVARGRAHAAQAQRIEIEAARDHDVPLSDRGREQARALSRQLHGVEFDRVYTSPYLRALETCRLAAGDRPFLADERLRERELGAFDRLTRLGIEKLFPEEALRRRAQGKFYHRPPGGESWCDVILRLRSFLSGLPQGRVLVFCHSAVILCFRYVMEGLTEEQILRIDAETEVANASITAYQDGKLERFNFVAPLAAEGAPVTHEPR